MNNIKHHYYRQRNYKNQQQGQSMLSIKSENWFALLVISCLVFCSTIKANELLVDPIMIEDFNLPPQDDQGWSILNPSSDSRLIYVDSVNGNDSSARIYSISDREIGLNPQEPTGNIKAFKSISAAFEKLRNGQPDWILLKAGGVWDESLALRNGRSPDERQVATTWGYGPRPELRTGSKKGILNAQLTNAAIIGIRFWAHTRDPDGPYFTDYEGTNGFSFFTRVPDDPRQVSDILIEDCHFHSYANNVLTSHYREGAKPLTRFVIRRTIISRNFSTTRHSQGLYFGGSGQPHAANILLEQNIFDHNGWRKQNFDGSNSRADGQATMFNHNTYFSSASGIIFKENIFIRPSSIGNKWTSSINGESRGIVIDNNLYIDGEVGISMGGNTSGSLRFSDIIIRNNVFTDIGRTQPTNRNLAWGLEASDWDTGVIKSNLFINQSNPNVTNTWAISIRAESKAQNIYISKNTAANLFASENMPVFKLMDGENIINVVINSNKITSNVENYAISINGGNYQFSGDNIYYTKRNPSRLFQINGRNANLNIWRNITDDKIANIKEPIFSNPERTIEEYILLLGIGNTYQDLIDALYQQSKFNWNPELTAASINAWFREGFNMSKTLPNLDTP